MCCQNEWHRLGNVADRSLTDIWRGPELRRLRERILVGDFGLGCEMCRISVDRGTPKQAYFTAFDHLPVDLDRLDWPRQLDLALSNTCNLRCVMCNGELSSSIRAQREHRPPLRSPYTDAFFEELDDFLPHLHTVSFLGGEPFLARESLRLMERLVGLDLEPVCHVTTNGTILNRRVERIVSALPVEVTVSVDAVDDETFARVREGADLGEVLRNLRRLIELAGKEHVRLAYCLMVPTWQELAGVLRLGDELDVDVVVNTVHHPPRLSFAHCAPDVLETAIRALRAQDRDLPTGRNAQVWDAQLDGLEALYEQRRAAGSATVTHVELGARRQPVDGQVLVHVDRRQIVDEVRGSATLLGVDVQGLLGGSAWQIVDLLTSSLGPLRHSEAVRTLSGEERVLQFDGERGAVRVVARMTPDEAGGASWLLEVREAPPAP